MSRPSAAIGAVSVSPEAAAAVLALVPDPSRLTYTHSTGCVALPVHTRFIALFRFSGVGQIHESAEGYDEEKRSEHGPVKAYARQAERQTPAPAEGPPYLRGHPRKNG